MDGAWIVAGCAAALAAAAWVVARRATRQARDLTDQYWQLKFDVGELRTRLDSLAPDPSAPPRTPAGTQFVPLTSVKR